MEKDDKMNDISALKSELSQEITAANDLKALDDVRVSVLGKKGRITAIMKTLGTMDPEERKTKGQALNVLKDEIAALIKKQESALKKTDDTKNVKREYRNCKDFCNVTKIEKRHSCAYSDREDKRNNSAKKNMIKDQNCRDFCKPPNVKSKHSSDQKNKNKRDAKIRKTTNNFECPLKSHTDTKVTLCRP